MDAGQPDTDLRSSIRNLVAVQEKQNASRLGYQTEYATGKAGATTNAAHDKGTADGHKRSQKRPNVNVTTNPLDISLMGSQPCNSQGCNAQGSGSVKSRGRSAGEYRRFLPRARERLRRARLP